MGARQFAAFQRQWAEIVSGQVPLDHFPAQLRDASQPTACKFMAVAQ